MRSVGPWAKQRTVFLRSTGGYADAYLSIPSFLSFPCLITSSKKGTKGRSDRQPECAGADVFKVYDDVYA